MTFRIGNGYDVHRFGEGDHVVLGGVTIPFKRGIVAHSDGDVVIHSLCDALFGAAGLGDIGRHFPDFDPEHKDADSREFLRRAIGLLRAQRFTLVNADMTIVAEAPRVSAYIPSMINNLAADTGSNPGKINVKATTTEGLGFAGRGEGLACYASVLLAVES